MMSNPRCSPRPKKLFLKPGILEDDEEDARSFISFEGRFPQNNTLLSPHPYIEITPTAAESITRISTQNSLSQIAINRLDSVRPDR
ncbi:hypothetical protein HHI36_014455 [Cryptolaemus montrouzieri]|uniref:Uncharacterized protein n=1 Tax=Cryptolaemus montrouzieri TaxID=559131 RepID=A0ABD2N2X5_9CUCU